MLVGAVVEERGDHRRCERRSGDVMPLDQRRRTARVESSGEYDGGAVEVLDDHVVRGDVAQREREEIHVARLHRSGLGAAPCGREE